MFPKLAELIAYLDSVADQPDPEALVQMLRDTAITRADIEPVCRFAENGYGRNTIKKTDTYELVTLCWRPEQGTPIHDHLGSSCAFKVIEGTATEKRFTTRDDGSVQPAGGDDVEAGVAGFVCARDATAIHDVSNNTDGDLVNLHVYFPPLRTYNRYSQVPGEGPRVVEVQDAPVSHVHT